MFARPQIAETICALAYSWLGAPRRRRGRRIVRPRMFRVAAAHLGAHRRVAAAPETGQVARRLHRPVRRREQLDHQRDFAAGNRRMAVEAEKLLDADRDFRSAFRFVIDRHVAAGRRCEMGGRFGVEPPLQREGEAGRQRGGEFIGPSAPRST